MSQKTLRVAISGTGFAGDYTARTYTMIPHKNGIQVDLAGVVSGRLENARRFAEEHNVRHAYSTHREMLDTAQPDIDNICCANFAHGPYSMEAAKRWRSRDRAGETTRSSGPDIRMVERRTPSTRKRETMAYLTEVLDAVRAGGSKLLYAEDFVYFDGIKGIVELLIEARSNGKGKVLYQRGVCAHQGSHAPAYDTPSKSGGGALFNKACHPLGPALYLKQVEGILAGTEPIRPVRVSAAAMQILKHQPESSGEHFRVMQNVDDFGRITVDVRGRNDRRSHRTRPEHQRNSQRVLGHHGLCAV